MWVCVVNAFLISLYDHTIMHFLTLHKLIEQILGKQLLKGIPWSYGDLLWAVKPMVLFTSLQSVYLQRDVGQYFGLLN